MTNTCNHSIFALIVRCSSGIEDDLFAAIFNEYNGSDELVIFAVSILLGDNKALVDDGHTGLASRRIRSDRR